MSDEIVVKVDNITRKFGELVAVNDVSLEVKKGELFGLLGPNGAGKTTLLKMLTGQLTPTAGESSILGLNPSKLPIEVKKNVGIVPEMEIPPSFLTPREFLKFIGMIREIEDIDKRVKYWLEFMDIEDNRTLCKDLSKGTKQKLVLAAAFIHDSKILFLDEPLINLDPIYQKKINEYFEEYLSKGGTIFLCTHILEIAEKLCNRVAIINHGKIAAIGSIKELGKEGEGLVEIFMRYVGAKPE
ncbi:MAG: ABC transporter ATP-binding protein [Thermoplasmata archaeon]